VADYTIAASKTAAHAKTLVADTEDTVTFTGRYESRPTLIVHPSSSVTSPVYVTADGSDPTSTNGTANVTWPGMAIELRASSAVPTVLRIKSAGTATYSVEVA